MVNRVGVTAEELVEHFPRLYHMAESGTWPSIKAHGLLSTSALLELYGVNGEERRRIEGHRRQESITIRHDEHGSAVIRDQKPISESALQKAPQPRFPLRSRRYAESSLSLGAPDAAIRRRWLGGSVKKVQIT